jgi:hypothetical protein
VREDQQDPAAGAKAPVPASAPADDAGAQPPGVPPGHSEQLRGIWSVTDAALSALDPQNVLDVLAARVKEALRG